MEQGEQALEGKLVLTSISPFPQTPQEAINGTYIDKKCPFTGEVSIRGRILTGRVVSTKMTRTIIIRREYLHFVPKYSRYEKRSAAAFFEQLVHSSGLPHTLTGQAQEPRRPLLACFPCGDRRPGHCRPMPPSVQGQLTRRSIHSFGHSRLILPFLSADCPLQRPPRPEVQVDRAREAVRPLLIASFSLDVVGCDAG